MRKYFSYLVLATTAVVAFASCAKELDNPKETTGKMKTITVQADIATKTTLDSDHANLIWSSGDAISIFNNVGNENYKATYASGGDLTVEVPAATTEIYALYPYYDGNTSGPESVSVYISKNQTQKNPGELNGYNYPMVAKGTVSADNKALISLYPVASALAINLYHSGLSGEERVVSVTVTPTTPNTKYTGSQVTDLTGDNITYTEAASSDPITVSLTNTLSLKSTKPADKQKFDGQIYVCLAKQNYESVKFEIVTNKGTYTITSKSDTPFNCVGNDFVPVTINLNNASFEASSDLSGTYAVLAKEIVEGTTSLYAMANTHETNSNRLDEIAFEQGATTTANRAIVWSIVKSGDNYSITDLSGKYLTASSSNNANVGADAAYCTIIKNSDGTYSVTQKVGDATRYLSRNNSDHGFAFYGNTGQNCKLQLTQIQLQAPPMLSWGADSITIDADDEDSHEIALTSVDATAVSIAVFDEDGETEIDWLVADYADGTVTYVADANTSEARKAVIVATATNSYGSIEASINVTQKADNSHITKGPVWTYTFTKTDFATANTVYSGTNNGLTLNFKSSQKKNQFDTSSGRGVQFGAAVGEFTITFSGYEKGVKSIKLVVSSNAASNTISASVGNTPIGNQLTLASQNNVEIEFSSEDLIAGGDIVFSINDVSKSVYIKSITINPDESVPNPVISLSGLPSSNVAAAGGMVSINYTVSNPVEGKTISASSSDTWVNSFNYSTPGVISFSVNPKTTSGTRTATITVSYEGAENKTFTLTQDGTSSGETATWVRVTSVTSLSAGDEIIITNTDVTYAIGPQANSNRTAKSVTASSDKSSLESIDSDVVILTLEGSSDNWMFNTGSNKYLYASSSSGNQLKEAVSSTAGDNGKWTITISNATHQATIQANGTNTRNKIRFNPNNGSPIFACYADNSTTGTITAIYKKVTN